MKICLITASRPHTGGIMNYLNNIGRGLNLLGHQTDIVSIFGTTKKIKTRSNLDASLGKILKNKEWLNFLAWQTIKIVIFFRFFKNYVQKKYDFVYVVDVLSANAIRLLENTFKIPVILNPIDSVSSVLAIKKMVRPGSWFFRYLLRQERKAYLNARAMLSSGTDITAYCQNVAQKPLEVPVLDNPIDETLFYIDSEAGEIMRNKLNLQNRFIVLYVGRLSPEKGIIYLLRAIPEILKKEPETNIFIAIGGTSGSEKENLIKYIETNHCEKYAQVIGYIADKDINAIYNMTDIFCAPSINFEGEVMDGFKNKNGQKIKLTISTATTTLQEAMACGKPVIGTNILGAKEIIKNNIDGLLVPEKNSFAIAEAILQIKNDALLRQNLSKEATQSVQNRFLPQIVAQKLIDFFQEHFNKNT